MRLFLFVAAASIVAVGFAAGCGSSGDSNRDDVADADADGGGSCPNEYPSACPSPEPSYEDGVLPILEERCSMCHFDAGIVTSGSGIDLGSYAAVYAVRGDVSSELNACRMPPATAIQPTLAQRATILGWLKCGSPDN
jgi:hypothetical protein